MPASSKYIVLLGYGAFENNIPAFFLKKKKKKKALTNKVYFFILKLEYVLTWWTDSCTTGCV
jgi:hypothetical protein